MRPVLCGLIWLLINSLCAGSCVRAVRSDYRAASGQLRWDNGVSGGQQIYIPLIARKSGPWDRQFSVVLHNQSGAALVFPSVAVVQITQPSVWNLWADSSSTATNASTDLSGTGNGSVIPTATPANGNSAPAMPTVTDGTASPATTPSVPSASTSPASVAGSDSSGVLTPTLPVGSIGANSDGSAAQNGNGNPPSGSTAQQTGNPATGTEGVAPSGVAIVGPGTGSGSAISPSATGVNGGSTSGSGFPAIGTGTGLLTQFASAFVLDSSTVQTDNSNGFVVIGVTRLQILPIGLSPCSVKYQTVDGTVSETHNTRCIDYPQILSLSLVHALSLRLLLEQITLRRAALCNTRRTTFSPAFCSFPFELVITRRLPEG